MAYKNKFDHDGKCITAGMRAETLFEQLAKEKGFTARAASAPEQFKHIDYWLERIPDYTPAHSVDVKARKRANRKDNTTDDDWIWLELQSVNGRKGWLLSDVNIIAFEQADKFVLVNRAALAHWLLNKSPYHQNDEYVTKSVDAKYKPYQRKGRRDIITRAKLSDIIENVFHLIWIKPKKE